MVKLPKDVVEEFVKELKDLLEKKENSLTKEEVQELKNNNKSYSNKIEDIAKKIDDLKKELLKFQLLIKPVPEEMNQESENRIQELIDLLILSGYYTKVIKPDGEYLEETGLYREEPVVEEEPVVVEGE